MTVFSWPWGSVSLGLVGPAPRLVHPGETLGDLQRLRCAGADPVLEDPVAAQQQGFGFGEVATRDLDSREVHQDVSDTGMLGAEMLLP